MVSKISRFLCKFMHVRIFEERGRNSTMFTGDFVIKVKCSVVKFMLGLRLSLGYFNVCAPFAHHVHGWHLDSEMLSLRLVSLYCVFVFI